MRIFAPLNSDPEPQLQEIEVATFFQLPSFQIIGLPSPEVAEAKERIRSAIEASGVDFPRKKVVLNLSPAHVRKRGTGLDLAMALAILNLKNTKQDSNHELRIGAWGELGLDGSVKSAGQLTRAMYSAWKGNLSYFILSSFESSQARVALEWIRSSQKFTSDPPQLFEATSLTEAWGFLKGPKRKTQSARVSLLPAASKNSENSTPVLMPLTATLERALGASVSGWHHLLLLGPRGTGKSHALEWWIALHPPGSAEDRLKQRLIAELSKNTRELNQVEEKAWSPIRRVSSQVKPAALIGGVAPLWIRPGEYSLAHGGMLIADELPEWHRDSRETLREPLERGVITLTRTQDAFELPARFLLGSNGNLCPCGGWPSHIPRPNENEVDREKRPSTFFRCRCTETVRRSYLSRLSGPILDRIDLSILLTQFPSAHLNQSQSTKEKLQFLKEKVSIVQTRLIRDWGKLSGHLNGEDLEAILRENPKMHHQISDLSISSLRSRHKILRLALTLSAWDDCDKPSEFHLVEASSYRAEKLLFFDETS